MSRIRTVKPELWVSEQVITCSPEARLLFIGMFNFSDDNGIHPVSYVRLKAEIFPGDNFNIDQIKTWVNQLLTNNLLREYHVADQPYWIIPGWHKHQRIDRPNPKYPLPESDLKKITESSRTDTRSLDDYSTNDQRALSESSQNVRQTFGDASPPEGKGKEGRGKDNDICEVGTSPVGVSTRKNAASKIKPSPEVLAVFKHWQTVMQYPRAKLDTTRQNIISKSLNGSYTVDELKQAINGCALTPFNMGTNDRGQRYDAIDLIFRDADHTDRFIANATKPPISEASNDSETDWMKGAI